MSIKDIISFEIRERIALQKDLLKRAGDSARIEGSIDALQGLLESFIDSLPEQPVERKSNPLFDECVKNCDPAVMKEVSDNVDKMNAEDDSDSGIWIFYDNVWERLTEIPAELDEAADEAAEEIYGYTAGTKEDLKGLFIAGAKWQKAKMMEGAVEGEVIGSVGTKQWVESNFLENNIGENGKKVKLIIVKENE